MSRPPCVASAPLRGCQGIVLLWPWVMDSAYQSRIAEVQIRNDLRTIFSLTQGKCHLRGTWRKETRAKSQLPCRVILGEVPKTSEHRSPSEALMITVPG